MAETPPVAPVKIVVDDYFGTKIADPYRYMEDFRSADVQAWVKQQAEFAETTLNAIPGREKLLARIRELDAGTPYNIFGITRRPNSDLFYFKQLADENVAKIYFRDGRSGKERLLIDPETFPKQNDGEHFTISFYRVSPQGERVMYGFAASGSEQTTLKVYDIASNKDLPDTIDRMEAEYAQPYWMPDGESFVFSRRRKLPADAPAADGYKFTQAFWHKLGDDVDQATLLFANGAPGSPKMGAMDFPAVVVPQGSPWAIGQIKHGDETDVTLYATPQATLTSPDRKWIKICDRTDKVTDFDVHGEDVFLVTAQDAPRFRVVRTPLAKPDFPSAAVVVPAGEAVVNSLAVAKDALYVGTLDGVAQKILRVAFDKGAAPQRIELPADEPSGSIAAASEEIAGVLIGTRSWIRAGRLYSFDPTTKKLTDTNLLPRGKFDDPTNIASQEVMVASHDGVRVPLSIIYPKNIKFDGTNPARISGYGAYGHIQPMRFDPISLAWLEQGGVIAIAHVRGGGEFGKEWHHAGRRATKPNTWKDFIACAEYLVKERYTSPTKLAGSGGSAGGILIGRSITERPDLFAAAQIAVGCTDMLRFETTMNGPPNVPEFGSVSVEDEFRGLLEMSTLQHIRDGVKYPAVILTHGINDPRVEPWQSAKTTARLQAASASGRPVLFRVDYHAGHGIGSTKQQRHEELADVWSFFLWQFGVNGFQPAKG